MNTKYIIIGLLCLGKIFTVYGQNGNIPRDTILYTISDKFNIQILTPDYDLLRENDRLANVIRDLQNDFGKILPDIPDYENYKIIYRHKAALEIEDKPFANRFRVENNEVTPIQRPNESLIYSEFFDMKLDFSLIEDLLDPDLPKSFQQMADMMSDYQRFLKRMEFKAENLTSPPVQTNEMGTGNLDMISFKFGLGGNMIRNQFLTDIAGGIGLTLTRKGIYKNEIYVSNNLLFSFDLEQQMLLNNFTNIGYRRNFSGKVEEVDWLGIEFGFITRRSGMIFPANAFRIGMNWDLGKNITVAPYLYFNDAFKQINPGFRIGFGI